MEQQQANTRLLFDLGSVVYTPGIQGLLGDQLVPEIYKLLMRHIRGDWGDLDEHDREANRVALLDGNRLLSNYEVSGQKIWVITEADRSTTTVLLPDEY